MSTDRNFWIVNADKVQRDDLVLDDKRNAWISDAKRAPRQRISIDELPDDVVDKILGKAFPIGEKDFKCLDDERPQRMIRLMKKSMLWRQIRRHRGLPSESDTYVVSSTKYKWWMNVNSRPNRLVRRIVIVPLVATPGKTWILSQRWMPTVIEDLHSSYSYVADIHDFCDLRFIPGYKIPVGFQTTVPGETRFRVTIEYV